MFDPCEIVETPNSTSELSESFRIKVVFRLLKKNPHLVFFSNGVETATYDYSMDEITPESFPRVGTPPKVVKVHLISLNRKAKVREIFAEHDRFGLGPATLEAQLAFADAHPNIQRRFRVATFGADLQDLRGLSLAPVLYACGDERRLNLDWLAPDKEYSSGDCFLASQVIGL